MSPAPQHCPTNVMIAMVKDDPSAYVSGDMFDAKAFAAIEAVPSVETRR